MALIAIIISFLSLLGTVALIILEYFKGGQDTKRWLQQLTWYLAYKFGSKKYKLFVDKMYQANKHTKSYRYMPKLYFIPD